MINELSTAAASLLLFFGGSQSSDEKVAPVKAESAFQCSQINQAAGSRDYRAVNEMIELSLRQLDKTYTDDSTIERFYQVRLRGEIPRYPNTAFMDHATSRGIGGLQRYKELYSQKIIDTCIETPNLGVLEAATNALNETYQLTTTTPFYALCNAYNKGTITYNSLIALALDSTISSQLAGVALVQREPAYGDAHLEAIISQQCALDPMQPALEVMFTSAHKTIDTARAEASAQATAEHNAKREIELQEQARYQQEQEQLQFEQEENLKFKSLYDNPESDVVCRDVSEQAYIASRNNDSKTGLLKTFEDAITRLNFESDRQQALISSLHNDSLRIVSLVLGYCQDNPTYRFQNVLNFLLPGTPLTETASTDQNEEADIAFNRIAVINDPDGYTNIRSQANAKSHVVSRIVEGEQFYTYEQEGRWWKVQTKGKQTGYVHVSRIRLLD
ncbi:SH3 domain-containing protein [Paenalcaligenes sp. Me52]|uniref:SH3 domain-containing protein n=1 Tax=Paenalcaligenes sp. Me52 TaxID=3392038 RepID=UPI003D2B057A